MGNSVPPACQSCSNPQAGGVDPPQDHNRAEEPLVNQVLDESPPACIEEAQQIVKKENRRPRYNRNVTELPSDGHLTVMMFGMTGAGKSALGNLIANQSVFVAADDTSSVTNLDSVLRYDAPDGSLVLLDTIGLGDTEIDQDKVIANIRDVALSAPRGVDVLLFVMRHARITDDAIARLIYVTEYLWGQDCLLNLYVVVTFASKYLVRPDEAKQWIERQAEINWRFKHIYNLVDNNANRFIFVDNPDIQSEEPNIDERQGASREAVMRVLAAHPRDVVPPFTHALMKKTQKMVEPQLRELETREREVQALEREHSDSTNVDLNSDTSPSPVPLQGSGSSKAVGLVGKPAAKPAAKKSPVDKAAVDNAKKRRADAKAKRLEAERALRKALEEVKQDAAFKEEAAREAEKATLKFAQKYQTAEEQPNKNPNGTNPVVACKRMLNTLSKTLRRRHNSKEKSQSKQVKAGAGAPLKQAPAFNATEDEYSVQAAEQRLDIICAGLRIRLKGVLSESFQKLAISSGSTRAGSSKPGFITPMIFQRFLNEMDPNIKRHQAGSLWRRGDANCDGRMDLIEFCDMFGDEEERNQVVGAAKAANPAMDAPLVATKTISNDRIQGPGDLPRGSSGTPRFSERGSVYSVESAGSLLDAIPRPAA